MSNNYGFVSTGFYRLLLWVWHFMLVNLLWLGFSLLGLIVFGIFPATMASMEIMRRFIEGEKEFNIVKSFYESFKREFWRANGWGLILGVVFYIIWFNYNYLGTVVGLQHTILSLGWYITVLLFALELLYLFPTYLYSGLKGKLLFKNSLLVALASPLSLISLIISIGMVAYVLYIVPGLIPFGAAPVLSWIVMWNISHAFRRIENKQKRYDRINAGQEEGKRNPFDFFRKSDK